MRRVPILVSRNRWVRLITRVTGSDGDGFPTFADVGGHRCRPVTARQLTVQRRREENCAHAHLSGGGRSYEGEWQDFQCDDCGASCPDLSSRARVVVGAEARV
jgi:hypothetical protein